MSCQNPNETSTNMSLMKDFKLSQQLNVLKSSLVISCVNVESMFQRSPLSPSLTPRLRRFRKCWFLVQHWHSWWPTKISANISDLHLGRQDQRFSHLFFFFKRKHKRWHSLVWSWLPQLFWSSPGINKTVVSQRVILNWIKQIWV